LLQEAALLILCSDGWESLGNKNWGWKGLAPYFRKHQTLDKTKSKSANPQFMPAAGGDEFHGSDGPIHTSFNDWYSPFEEDFVEAAYEVTGGKDGKRTLHDAWSGDHVSERLAHFKSELEFTRILTSNRWASILPLVPSIVPTTLESDRMLLLAI
jgi:hypothetical protein